MDEIKVHIEGKLYAIRCQSCDNAENIEVYMVDSHNINFHCKKHMGSELGTIIKSLKNEDAPQHDDEVIQN